MLPFLMTSPAVPVAHAHFRFLWDNFHDTPGSTAQSVARLTADPGKSKSQFGEKLLWRLIMK